VAGSLISEVSIERTVFIFNDLEFWNSSVLENEGGIIFRNDGNQ